MKQKITYKLWGLLFILLAAILLLKEVDIIPNNINIWGITVLCIGAIMAIHSLYELTFPGFYTGLAIVYFELSNMTALPYVSILVLAIAVVFLSIGTSLLIPARLKYIINDKRMRKHRNYNQRKDYEDAYADPDRVGKYQTVENNDSEYYAYGKNSFGATSKYINIKNLQGATLECKFGELKAYFDGSVIENPPIDINVHCSFGTIKLYIPNSWKINPIANVSFGDIQEKNRNDATNGPVVNLLGYVSFGSIEINYI